MALVIAWASVVAGFNAGELGPGDQSSAGSAIPSDLAAAAGPSAGFDPTLHADGDHENPRVAVEPPQG